MRINIKILSFKKATFNIGHPLNLQKNLNKINLTLASVIFCILNHN